jgi:hypothetical protein
MKKYFLLFGLLVIGQFCPAQNTVVMFLDIQGIDGEYIVPTRSTVTPIPLKTNNLLIDTYDFDWVKTTRMPNQINGNFVNGGVTEFGEMEVVFKLDKSVIGIFDKLVNNTKTAIVDLFIDKPANSLPTDQTELQRIRMEQVTISSLSMINLEIPQYKMTLKFEKVSIIVHSFDGLGVATKGSSYGFNFLTGNSTGIYGF